MKCSKHLKLSFLLILILVSAAFTQDDTKTITGYVIDQDGRYWNDQVIELHDGTGILASDTLVDGYFEFQDVTIVSVQEESPSTTFHLEQNYPNPFNPSTVIQYSIDVPQTVKLSIYDVLGREIISIVNAYQQPGSYRVFWNGLNNNGIGVSAGVYIYLLKGANKQIAKKMVLLDGASHRGSYNSQMLSSPTQQSKLLNKIADNYYLHVFGPDVITTDFRDLDFSGEDVIDLGMLTANAKPRLKGKVYLAGTQFDEGGNKITPPGIEGKKVYLQSDPDNPVYTDAEGNFEIVLDTIPENIIDSTFYYVSQIEPWHMTIKDTIFVIDESNEMYNYKAPIGKTVEEPDLGVPPNFDGTIHKINEVKFGDSKITGGISDTIGIALFERAEYFGEDFLTYMIERAAAKLRWENHPMWEGMVPRVKDTDLPVKVYMNRDNDPTDGWYSDSTWEGTKLTEAGRLKYVETTDSSYNLIMWNYDSQYQGHTIDSEIEYDEFGPHTTYWEFSLRGPTNGPTLSPEVTNTVAGHEVMHMYFGFHSQEILDLFYYSASNRAGEGIPPPMRSL